jgi:hypothetical protein
MRARTLLIGLAMLISAGCMPVAVNYYRPVVQEASIRGSLCGRGGPKDTAVFRAGAATLAVRLASRRNATLHLIVRISLPEGHRARLASDSLHLDGVRYPLGPARSWDAESGNVNQVHGTLTGTGQAGGSPFRSQRQRPRNFTYDIQTGRATAPRHHLLRLPPIVVDGTPHVLPEISFVPHRGVFVSPLNC